MKYQKNFQPCPKCGRPKSTRAKTCAYCAGRGKGSVKLRDFIKLTCTQCKDIFEIPSWRIKQGRGQFCSRKCADAYLKTLTGIKSMRWRGGSKPGHRGIGWRIARQWALVRANNKCEKCTSEKQLNVHHIKPFHECKDSVEANSPKNLIVLCLSCHMKVESLGKITNGSVLKGGDANGVS